jgi:hypothetical protein
MLGLFVEEDVLYRWTICIDGRFVEGCFVEGCFVEGRFVEEGFIGRIFCRPGRFVGVPNFVVVFRNCYKISTGL